MRNVKNYYEIFFTRGSLIVRVISSRSLPSAYCMCYKLNIPHAVDLVDRELDVEIIIGVGAAAVASFGEFRFNFRSSAFERAF